MKLTKNTSVLILLICSKILAQSDSTKFSFNGQITTWGIVQLEKSFPVQFGGRFVPTVLGDFKLEQNSHFDFEASANLNASLGFSSLGFDTLMGQVKPYRVWLRYSGSNWELRAGLQKINFGQAKMFRPLMWFDAMDVRDPLQLTDGVYGVLGKYFFENNANIWVWGLMGNKNAKGYELYGSMQRKPELGGRIQTPLGPGEIGVSTHFRKVKVPNLPSSIPNNDYELNESRFGLDGKWDLGIGLWIEASTTITDKKNFIIPNMPKMQDMWNIGMDYTFPLGNGVGATLEYFRYHAGEKFIVYGNTINVVGSLFTYPLSILDNLSAMIFYLPEANKTMNYVSYSRTYDNFSIYGIAYWNPMNVQLMSAQSVSQNMFVGKGFQVMINYNF